MRAKVDAAAAAHPGALRSLLSEVVGWLGMMCHIRNYSPSPLTNNCRSLLSEASAKLKSVGDEAAAARVAASEAQMRARDEVVE